MLPPNVKKHWPTTVRLRIITAVLALYIISTGAVKAQTPEYIHGNFSSWFLMINRFQLTPRWSITNELHERTGSFLHDQGQFLWRPSVDYSLNKNVEFSVGYSLIHVDPYEPFNQKMTTTEHNIWEQVMLKWDVGKVHFANRFRQEERWAPNIQTDVNGRPYYTYDHKNRFRYRFIVSFDLFKIKNSKGAFFANIWDEYWFNNKAKSLAPESFTRNWAYAAIGYRFNPTMNLQVGYMNQLDYAKVAGVFKYVSTPILQVTFVKNFSFIKKETK